MRFVLCSSYSYVARGFWGCLCLYVHVIYSQIKWVMYPLFFFFTNTQNSSSLCVVSEKIQTTWIIEKKPGNKKHLFWLKVTAKIIQTEQWRKLLYNFFYLKQYTFKTIDIFSVIYVLQQIHCKWKFFETECPC